jgi:hypothetical protein
MLASVIAFGFPQLRIHWAEIRTGRLPGRDRRKEKKKKKKKRGGG